MNFNFLKSKVRGNRRSMKEGDYDLDLSYICDNRIIVMSFPGSGALETSYRNDSKEVKRFLDERHPEKYWVFNVSEKVYESARFDGRVSNYNW